MKIKRTDKTVLLAGLLWFAKNEREMKMQEASVASLAIQRENRKEAPSPAKLTNLTAKCKRLVKEFAELEKAEKVAERNLRAAAKKAKGDPASYGAYNVITIDNGDTAQFKIGDDTFGHEILMATINGKRLNIRGGLVRGGGITVFPLAQNVIEVQP